MIVAVSEIHDGIQWIISDILFSDTKNISENISDFSKVILK